MSGRKINRQIILLLYMILKNIITDRMNSVIDLNYRIVTFYPIVKH